MKKNILKILICLIFVMCIAGCGEKVKIVKNEASKIEFEEYNNGLVKLQIPKGWQVDVAPSDYIHYSFKVYNPEDKNYMLLFGLKLEGFLKSDLAKKTWKSYYPTSPFSSLPVINPQTTEAFYKIWNETKEIVNKDANMEFYPTINEFTILENLGESPLVGGDILRATYKSGDDKLIQGLFTASVKDVGSYYINVNYNPMSKKVDVWPLNVYNIVLLTAPDEEFINWQGILDKSLGSIEFSDTFIKGFNNEETTLVNTIKANQKVYDSISDMIMDSWEKRNNSYDIISQKQSDATLGYERVYDTETGEIYKAYNGFTNEYNGTRYQSITDDMYTKAISGYIEK